MTPVEIKRRVKIAERILPRRSVLGEALEPQLAEVAKAVMGGGIGEDHLKVITNAMDKLPSCVSVTDRTTWRMVMGPQGRDGMSRVSGYVDQETRAYVEVAAAAVRPGRHLPDGTVADAR